MDLNILVAVSVIWALAAITPGPNFFIAVHTAIDTSRRFSLFTVLGIVVGTLAWSLTGYLGISILFKTVPLLYVFLKIIGGLYLVYVGFNLIFKTKKQPKHSTNRYQSPSSCFRLGLLTNLLNPKTAAFMTSLFAATIPPDASIKLGVLSVLLICSISATWYTFVSIVFSHNIAKKLYEKQKLQIERLAGTIFIGFGLKLAISK